MTDTPQINDIVKDTDTNKVGKVMGFVGPHVQLRPLGGGREWDAQPENLEWADPAQALRAGVAEANARSRRGAAVATNSVLPTQAGVLRTTSGTPSASAECTLAEQPGYEDMHNACRETQDVPLPGATGILLAPRCGCNCHTTVGDTS